MDILLSHSEVRVLGALMEKEMATPDYYPLTLNALTNACNQKSNRNPVVSFDEQVVEQALSRLRELQLVRQSSVGRALKYEQIFSEKRKLLNRETAILCILLLRGPQTAGEIRGRTERLYPFKTVEEVKESIESLIDMALVVLLPREPGRKEPRYAHTMGEPSTTLDEIGDAVTKNTPLKESDEGQRITLEALQLEVSTLRQELAELRNEFEKFTSQFD